METWCPPLRPSPPGSTSRPNRAALHGRPRGRPVASALPQPRPTMQYPEVDSFDPVAVEEAVLARWQAEDTFRQSLALREGAPHFVFYEGPPTANGKPGIHHVMARTIKDLFCRYKTMRGFRVDRKAGWDTHGLPVEIEVEKALGLEGRHAVEAFGIAEYNAACRESVLRYKDLWDDLTRRMGYWVDLEDPYVTFETDYIESVWNLLKRIWDKGLLSKGFKIQWYSPANGTVLSSHEVSLGYKEVQDVSVTVRFPSPTRPRRRSWLGPRRRGRCPRTPRSSSGRRSTTSRSGSRPCRTTTSRALGTSSSGSPRSCWASSRSTTPTSSTGARGPTWSASSTSRPTTTTATSAGSPRSCRTTTPRATPGAWWRPTTSRPKTGPASSTRRRRSAWTTTRRARKRGCRPSTPSSPTAGSARASPSLAGCGSRTPTAPSCATSRSAGCCSARTATSTTTPTTGARGRP